MSEIQMTLERDLTHPVTEAKFPRGYALVNVTENCRHLWETFMDECFGGYQAGSFRYVYVNNNFYEENRVFVLLNEKNKPIGTGNSWQTPDHEGYISWIGVSQAYRGKAIGVNLTNYCLHDIKKRGLKTAIITTEKENLPALKTYLKCGFVPLPRSEEDIRHWEEIYDLLNISSPLYVKTIRPETDTPHPPRPWPYQLAREQAANANGDLFVHGLWNRFNMYEVDPAEYGKLQNLVSDDKVALEWFQERKRGENGAVYVDSDINPQAVLLTHDQETYRFGASEDGCFEDGIVLFTRERASSI